MSLKDNAKRALRQSEEDAAKARLDHEAELALKYSESLKRNAEHMRAAKEALYYWCAGVGIPSPRAISSDVTEAGSANDGYDHSTYHPLSISLS